MRIDEDKANEYGLTIRQIAFTVRNAFEGMKATDFRDGDEEIDVIVKFGESARTTLKDVANLKLMGATGVPVPLRDVARLNVVGGYSTIYRYKQERAITLTANVDEKVTSTVSVNQRLHAHFNQIKSALSGIHTRIGRRICRISEGFHRHPRLLRLWHSTGLFYIGNAVQVFPPTTNYSDDRTFCIHRCDGGTNYFRKPSERGFNIRARRASRYRR